MSTGQSQADPTGPGGQPSEEELRAAYEAEIKRITVDQVLLEQIVSLVNLGMRRTGLSPGTEDERDPAQVRMAIEAVRVLLPLIEATAAPQAGAIREALSQLQLAFVRLGGAVEGAPGAAPSPGGPAAPPPGGPGTPPPGGSGTPPPGGSGTPAPGGPAPSPGAGAPGAPPAPGEAAEPGEAGPAQRSGRLWIPGQ